MRRHVNQKRANASGYLDQIMNCKFLLHYRYPPSFYLKMYGLSKFQFF